MESKTRTQVLVAVIGLAGVIGVAVISKWDRFFPSTSNPRLKAALTLEQMGIPVTEEAFLNNVRDLLQ